jgi:hypothetical protein
MVLIFLSSGNFQKRLSSWHADTLKRMLYKHTHRQNVIIILEIKRNQPQIKEQNSALKLTWGRLNQNSILSTRPDYEPNRKEFKSR